MIKINLLGEEQQADTSGLVFFGGWLGSFLLVCAVVFLFYNHVNDERARLEDEVASRERQLKELQEKTKEVKDLQAKQNTLNEKLAVIARLKRSKIGPVRVLDDLNLAVPERSWLLSVVETTGTLALKGMAIDDNDVATLMEKLEHSDYFGKVELIYSRQVKYDAVNIREFEIRTQVNYLGRLAASVASSAASAGQGPT